MSKGGTVLPSAQTQIAGETNRSRLDRARLSFLALIGVIVAMAIICIAVAELSTATAMHMIAIATMTPIRARKLRRARSKRDRFVSPAICVCAEGNTVPPLDILAGRQD